MIIQEYRCYICGQETLHFDGKCSSCYNNGEKQKTLAWNALTLEEKLANLNARLRALEQVEPKTIC